MFWFDSRRNYLLVKNIGHGTPSKTVQSGASPIHPTFGEYFVSNFISASVSNRSVN
jgi:hypothetical protein